MEYSFSNNEKPTSLSNSEIVEEKVIKAYEEKNVQCKLGFVVEPMECDEEVKVPA